MGKMRIRKCKNKKIRRSVQGGGEEGEEVKQRRIGRQEDE